MNDSTLLFDFIRRSPSPWHAVKTAAEALDEAGYTRLEERESWQLVPGGKYYTTREGASPIAWRQPAAPSDRGIRSNFV